MESLTACTEQDLPEFLDRVGDFLAEQIRHEPSFTPRPEFRDGCLDVMKKMLSSANYFIDLARHDGRVTGFLISGLHEEPLFITSRQGYIADLYVAPERRRQGLGRRLVEHGVSRLRNHGAHYIQLNVLAANAQGLAFWHTMGFQDHTHRMRMDLCDIPALIRDASHGH